MDNKYKKTIIVLLINFLAILYGSQLMANNIGRLITINGPIGPATAEYVVDTITAANADAATVIILQIDTPGGLSQSMRSIIKSILKSAVPVVSYVAPSGARAASAGTYILYASHIAAMAPGTNLGAATPVRVMGSPLPQNPKPNPSTEKMTNDAIAYIKSLAQLRGRNAQWAVSSVDKAASLPAQEALEKNVINLIATNTNDLLQQLNGVAVKTVHGKVLLKTDHLTLRGSPVSWRIRFLSIITNPSIAYILLLIGIYGLFFEFMNPGMVIPGVLGGICLIIGFYALQLLPVNYAGFALVLLGLIFMAAEAMLPSFGALGFGGVIAFIVGSIFLFKTDVQGFRVAWPLIITMAVVNIGFFLGVVGMAIRSRQRDIVSGREQLLNMQGIADDDFTKTGWIKIRGERWQCVSHQPLKKGERVKVIAIDGLNLIVEKVTD